MSIPRHLSDRYELGELLGLGGMSEVHRGRDVRLGRDVAIKVLRADLARDPGCYLRFRREAQHAAALNHPMIVAIYDTGEVETVTGPSPYIVMEYVEGETLREVISRDGPMEPIQAIEVIADACQALDFSHQRGIVHRDVKPANVMISRAGAVKVMDFGIARTLAETTGASRLTATAAVLGTAAYLSPEQARGEDVDARSDVYALGCVLYEMLTGTPPFVGDTPVAVAYQHVRQDPEAPSQRQEDISAAVDAVVLKALAKNPENRYQSAAELRNDLIRVRAGDTPHAPKVFTAADHTDLVSASPDGQASLAGWGWAAARQARSSRRWLVMAALAVIVTVVATIAVHGWGWGATPAVRVPDVHGQTQRDAVAALQGLGFTIGGPVLKPDPTLPMGQVIDTDPGAHTALAGGEEVTVEVSSGPEQRTVPPCTALAVEDCLHRLADTGFTHPAQTPTSSATVPAGVVIATSPLAGQTSPLVNDVVVYVSTGPATQSVPDVSGQSVDAATTSLKTTGFQIILTSPTDSMRPAGEVVSTDPPAGTTLPVRSPVTLRVSLRNQVLMPSLVGKTYLEIVPLLQGLGFVGLPAKGDDVPGPSDQRFIAVQQVPPAGIPVRRDVPMTVNYGS